MRYHFLKDIAIGETAFEAYGKSLTELFENCAVATFAVIVNLKDVKRHINYFINLEADSIDNLLHYFLSELIYVKDTKELVFSKFYLEIDDKIPKYGYKLKAKCLGEKIDRERHNFRVDIKAVTWHLFKIKKEDNLYTATVVVDV